MYFDLGITGHSLYLTIVNYLKSLDFEDMKLIFA